VRVSKDGGTTVTNPSRAYKPMAPDISREPTSSQFRPCCENFHTTYLFRYEYKANATRRLQGVMEVTRMPLNEARRKLSDYDILMV